MDKSFVSTIQERIRRNNIFESRVNLEIKYNEFIKGNLIRSLTNTTQTEGENIFYNHQLLFEKGIPKYSHQEKNEIIYSESLLFNYKAEQPYYIISYNSKKLKFFTFIINILSIYSVQESLNDLSFALTFSGKPILQNITWILFIIDFFLNFFTEKICKNKSLITLKEIAIFYVKSWALFDLLALLPLRFFGHPNAESFFKLLRIFKMKRLFEMLDVRIIAKIFIIFSNENTFRYRRFHQFLKASWDLVQVILAMTFFCFALACLWWYFSLWLDRNDVTKLSFIDKYDLHDRPISDQLIICMYFIFTTVLTVGYGDYSAGNFYQMGACLLILFFGTIWFTVTMSEAAKNIKKLSHILYQHGEMGKLKKFIANLEKVQGPMPSFFKHRIILHFSFYWKNDRLKNLAKVFSKTKTVEELLENHDQVMKNLPLPLKKDIYEYLFKDYFGHFPLYFSKNCNFKYQICQFFQPRKFLEDCILLAEGCKSKEILLLSEGDVDFCYTDIGESLVSVKVFTGWNSIGDFGVLFNRPSFATYKAKTDVIGMSIQKEAFITILEKIYPKQYEILKAKVKRRTMKLLELMSKCGYDQYQDVIDEMFENSVGYRQTIKMPPLNIAKVNEILRNGSAKLSNLEVRLRKF